MKKSEEMRELEGRIDELEDELAKLYEEKRKLETADIESYVGKCYREDVGCCTDEVGKYYKILSIDTERGGFSRNRYKAEVLYLNNNEDYPCIDFMLEFFPFEFCHEEVSSEEFEKQTVSTMERLLSKMEKASRNGK